MNRFTSPNRRDVLLAAGALAASPFARAQPAGWPNKPIRIIVAFPPGGLTDAYARLYAEHLGARVSQPVVVENRPGAGAVIAIDAVAKSAADGHTLLMTTSGTVWQNRILYTKLPYNLEKDITPVTIFPSGPLVVAVPEKLGVGNFKDFITWLKANPDSNMGSYAPGSYPHMLADQLNRTHRSRLQSVQYKGESPMWVDVAGGQLHVAVGSYQAFNTVSTRGVKAIGVTGTYRSPKLPDVPTLTEQGVEDALVKLEGGLPLMAPAGTPEPVLRFLADVAVAGAEAPSAVTLRSNFGIPNKPPNLEGTRALFTREVPVWVKLAQDLGIKLD